MPNKRTTRKLTMKRSVRTKKKQTSVKNKNNTDNAVNIDYKKILFYSLIIIGIIVIIGLFIYFIHTYIVNNNNASAYNNDNCLLTLSNEVPKTGWKEFDDNNEIQNILNGIMFIKCMEDFNALRRSQVLYIDTAKKNRQLLNNIDFNLIFPSKDYEIITIDALKESTINPFFFEKYPQDRPLIIISKNVDISGNINNFTDSFTAFLANDQFQGSDIVRKSYNTAFIFLAATLPDGPECNNVQLDIDYLLQHFIMTFVTRLTNIVKIC